MKEEMKTTLYPHQLKAIEDLCEGNLFPCMPMIGYQCKTNLLQHVILKMDSDARARFLRNAIIISPNCDIASDLEAAARFASAVEAARPTTFEESIAAVSGGGRIISRNYDHVKYYTTPKSLVICSERPNTTDMFRMFRDGRNKPKRGKK